jgi:anti-anti-sigma factor
MSSTPFPAGESTSTTDGLRVAIDPNASPPRRRVRVSGELDLATAPLLASTLDQQAAGCAHLELDLSGLVFCDLIGLTTLEQAQQRLRRRGCQLSIHHIHGQPRRLLDIDGLPTTLSARPSPSTTRVIPVRPRRTLANLVTGLLRKP